MELYKEHQQKLSQSNPASPTELEALRQSPKNLASTATAVVMSPLTPLSPVLSSSSSPAASFSSASSLPNITQGTTTTIPRRGSPTSTSTDYTTLSSQYSSSPSPLSPNAQHTRSFSSYSPASSIVSSPSMSASPVLLSASRRGSSNYSSSSRRSSSNKAVRILELSTGPNAAITSILTMLAEEGYVHPKEDLDITTSDGDQKIVEKLKNNKLKGWDHVKLKTFAPESVPSQPDWYNFVYICKGMHWVQDEDATLREIYRVLQPGGTAGFSSFKSIGYTSSGSEDPLGMFPNSGWCDSRSIQKKLSKHHFTDIQIWEYRYSASWKDFRRTSKQVIGYIVDQAIKKLWKDENDASYEGVEDAKSIMKEQLMSMYKDGNCRGDIVALITLARKPEIQPSRSSYF